MMGMFNRKLDIALAEERGREAAEVSARASAAPPTLTIDQLSAGPVRYAYDDGEKFAGGYGPIDILLTDYWSLRARSSELFEKNLFARGIICRLVTNEINTGLHLEATPNESVLGYGDDELAEWSETVENLFELWGKSARACDFLESSTLGALQAAARLEALVAGDVLVILSQDRRSQLPRVRLVSGSAVQSPGYTHKLAKGHRMVHGVELDASGRHVAYWIRKRTADGRDVAERLAAYGPKSGRRVAWLQYGTDKRLDDVRGKPLLSLVLQSLKEIDRYRDSVQRKATINALLAIFVEKTQDGPASKSIAGGARRRGTEVVTDGDGTTRNFASADLHPGMILEQLQPGEKVQGFQSHGTDEKFGDFERAILQGVAWSLGIPPEILTLSFGSNYSASQAAINEFKIYLNRTRQDFGQNFCQPIYQEWLLSQALRQTIEARGLLDYWRDPLRAELAAAWFDADWAGAIKPAVDVSKLVRGYNEMVESGFITRRRATRELTGTKYAQNVRELRRENEALAEANESLEPAPAAAPAAPPPVDVDEDEDEDEDDGDDTKPKSIRIVAGS